MQSQDSAYRGQLTSTRKVNQDEIPTKQKKEKKQQYEPVLTTLRVSDLSLWAFRWRDPSPIIQKPTNPETNLQLIVGPRLLRAWCVCQ